ncbi:MAG: hypothetical protein AAF998_11600 [Bacteroidota bacterium]
MRNILGVLLAIGASMAVFGFSPRPKPDDAKVILVDLRVATPDDAKQAFSEQFDHKRVELSLEIDDPINTLEDFALGEKPLEGPGCFMPDLKVIFRTHTYVFSLYCTEVVKYRNSAPYTPSGRRVQNDIRITQSVLNVLEETREKHFGKYFDPEIAKRFVKDLKLEAIDEKVDDSELYKEEVDEDEKALEKEAEDKEGWFDEDKDPELEKDETPELDEDDGG